MLVTLRTSVPPLTIAARVRQELRAIDPALPVLRINTVDQQVDDVLAQDRLLANLSTFFAVAAVLLACLGLFGVVSYGVSRRTNEIGVRMAVGATERGVFAMIVGESSRLVAAGLALGLGGALASSGVLSSRLYGVNAADPLTIAAAVALLVVVAGIALYIPARRASRVQPLVALRCD